MKKMIAIITTIGILSTNQIAEAHHDNILPALIGTVVVASMIANSQPHYVAPVPAYIPPPASAYQQFYPQDYQPQKIYSNYQPAPVYRTYPSAPVVIYQSPQYITPHHHHHHRHYYGY